MLNRDHLRVSAEPLHAILQPEVLILPGLVKQIPTAHAADDTQMNVSTRMFG